MAETLKIMFEKCDGCKDSLKCAADVRCAGFVVSSALHVMDNSVANGADIRNAYKNPTHQTIIGTAHRVVAENFRLRNCLHSQEHLQVAVGEEAEQIKSLSN